MLKKNIMKVFALSPLLLALQSCMMPGTSPVSGGWNNGGFPSSTTETHTKTTIVTPPSYATVNIPPPAITQGQAYVQQPMMYQAPMPMQSSQCQSYQASPADPCNYNVSVPQQSPARYTIAIPPAPAPEYTIALPQGNPPQYAVMQNQQPVQASMPVKLQAQKVECE